MPSPVIHSLAGFALERVDRHVANPASVSRVWVSAALVLGANAADLDFIPGILIGDPGRFHHRMSHSLLAAAIFGVASGLLALKVRLGSPRRFGLLMGLAFVTHLVLDMLSTDHGVRHGVQLFWPVYEPGIYLPVAVFSDIKRDPDLTSFIQSLLLRHNAYALAWEFVVLAIAVSLTKLGRLALAATWSGGRRRRLPRRGAGATD